MRHARWSSTARARRRQLSAQRSVRDILIVDSLSPAKTQLRDYVAELRDTLDIVESIHAQHRSRAMRSGMSSVVQSSGHQLGRRCRTGACR